MICHVDSASMEHDGLEKTLKNRHLSMIAIGGALGTGLLIGTGQALVKSGPAAMLIDYCVVGVAVYLVMAALGEMTSFSPMSRGFGGYATRFVDPALGFATGYAYWFKYLMAIPNQLAAVAIITEYWVGDRVSGAVFITAALILVLIINFAHVQAFGEFEFWLSSLKIIIMCGMIILMLVLALGGGPNHDRTGFRYWQHPGAFAEYKSTGSMGRFVGVWSTMIQAVYAYSGTELVAVTIGEAKNPKTAIVRAIRLTFFRILFFYVLSILLLGMVVPYNNQDLAFAAKSAANAAASPFVVAIKIAKIPGLDHVVNTCLLIFVVSAATSDFYIASRTIFNIASDGKAPNVFRKANSHGTPVFAMIIPALFSLLAYMSVGSSAKTVFGYLTSLVAVFRLLTWISILTTHICFCRAVKFQKISADQFLFRAPLREWGSAGTLIFLCILILTKGFEVFIGQFDYKNFIVQYIGIPVYLMLLFGYKLYYKTSRVTSSAADLVTGVGTEPRGVEEGTKKDSESKSGRKFYQKYVSWLF